MITIKKQWLAYAFFTLSFICMFSFQLIGAHVDENGFLIEPFALIPLFWLFLLFGCTAFLATFILQRRSN